jgi:antigen flippase
MSSTITNQLSTPTLQPSVHPGTKAPAETSTYGQILRSSALVGGSSALNIAIGIVRSKAMAVLLGPSGVGLFGLFNSISDLTLNIVGMGINSSGVRQIAEAAGSGNQRRIEQTTTVLRWTSLVLGCLAVVLLIAFARPISLLTFGTDQHATAISFLSIAVLFRLVSNGQGALIQGMRRIADLAKMNALGSFLGTALTIPIIYFLRDKGVVLSLIAVSGMTVVISYWYSRKIKIPSSGLTVVQVRREATGLLKLGSAFMASGMMMMGAAYVVQITVLHRVGFEATGLYQSAWTLGGMYVGFILQAMGADFYPRLTASASDHAACNRMVNEQARVGLLLAGPGVIATLSLAPLLIAAFYSTKFSGAVDLLRWISLGATLRVINWPMGYIILAKGKQQLFFWSELAWTVANVSLTWICVGRLGLIGVGVAFLASYLLHGLLIYMIVRRVSGFRWSTANKQTCLIFLTVIATTFGAYYLVPFAGLAGIGVILSAATGIYSVRVLLRLVSHDNLSGPLRSLLGLVRSA